MSFTESIEKMVAEDRSGLLGVHRSWQRIRLGDVASILNGYAFPSASFTKNDGTPLIRIRDITDSATEAWFLGDFEPQYLVEAGDLLVGMDGDFNCALWRGPRALLNQRVCKITPDQRFLGKRFLLAALPAYLKAVNDATSSVTVKHLSSRTLGDLPLPFPPRVEQERIADEVEKQFTRLDAAVAGLQRVKANLKRYRASVLKAACEGRLVPTEAELARREGRSFESGEELLKRILKERRARWEADQLAKMKAAGRAPRDDSWRGRYDQPFLPDGSPFDSLPEGWFYGTVDQLATLVQYGTSAKTSADGGAVPVLRMGNLREGRLVLDDLKFLPVSHDEFPDLLLSSGDLLFNRTNSPELVGKTAVFRGSPAACSFASYLIRIRLATYASAEFLSAFVNSLFGRRWVKSVVTQVVGQANVNGTKLRQLVIPLPPAAEQHRIVAEVERRLSVVDELDATVEKNLARCASLRQSILKMAFEGRLVPQDPNDEPASVLLERIRSTRAAGAISAISPSTGSPRGRKRAKHP